MTTAAREPRREGAVLSAAPPEKIGRYRWTICALLFFATTINYMDRQVLGILAPTLQKDIGWNDAQYGTIVSYFTLAYALGYIFAGRVMDWLGVRRGYALAIVTWSVAAMSHALARTAAGFSAARFALGLGESGNFPAAIKTVAEWFPARERAFATGIFNAGTNVGAIVTPMVVPFIARTWGWRAAFIWTGLLSATWLGFWLSMPPPRTAPLLVMLIVWPEASNAGPAADPATPVPPSPPLP